MRRALVGVFVLALVLVAPANASGSARLFGKSYTQILAMGQARWMEYQAKKSGGSTADVSEGLYAYRDALRWRNDGLTAKASNQLRRDVSNLRPLLTRFADEMETVRSYQSGGGSMWSNVHASFYVEVEYTLCRLLGGPGTPASPHRTGEVVRAFNNDAREIEKARRELPGGMDGYDGAVGELKKARETFQRIVRIAAHLPRSRSDEVLASCLWLSKAGTP